MVAAGAAVAVGKAKVGVGKGVWPVMPSVSLVYHNWRLSVQKITCNWLPRPSAMAGDSICALVAAPAETHSGDDQTLFSRTACQTQPLCEKTMCTLPSASTARLGAPSEPPPK